MRSQKYHFYRPISLIKNQEIIQKKEVECLLGVIEFYFGGVKKKGMLANVWAIVILE